MSLGDLAACALERWTPGIGDPSAWGWITVLVYAGAAGCCALAAARTGAGRERLMWSMLAAGLLVLAVNKQLDLQSGLTAIGRCHAQAAGWYGEHRRVQAAFIGVVALTAVLGAVGLGWSLRRRLRRLWPVVLGTALILGFVTIRAASFHHVDVVLGEAAFGVTVNAALEVGGTLLIAWGAARTARAAGSRP